MALELLVDESKYREALGKLDTELTNLRTYRRDLEVQINRMTGATFSGTSVQGSIDKARDIMRATDKMIERTQKQRDSIEYQLNQSQTAGSTLERAVNDIKIPDLFR